MKPRAESPFVRRAGALCCEGLVLAELAAAREGRPAWLLSQAALRAALARPDGPRAVSVGAVGPPEVLAMVAQAGHWAACLSSHELTLALEAGFGPERVLAAGAVRDDGFLKDALLAGVTAVTGEADRLNVERLASALAVELGAAGEAPPPADPRLLSEVGGLLAPVLNPPPAVALDAPLPAATTPVAEADEPRRVLCLQGEGEGTGTLVGLSRWKGAEPVSARIQGQVDRGGWVVVPHADAVGALPPDVVHPQPEWVLIHDGRWRELKARPLPPVEER